jgi:hypothetical protein
MCSPSMNNATSSLSNRSKECKIGMLSHINLMNLLDDSVNNNTIVELFEDQINTYIKVIESTSKIYELCNDNQSNIEFLVSYCLLTFFFYRLCLFIIIFYDLRFRRVIELIIYLWSFIYIRCFNLLILQI